MNASLAATPDVGPARRIAWGVFAVFLAAFAVFEAVKYGLPTTAAALVSLAVPFTFRTSRIAQSALLPLAVLLFYTFGPIVFPPLFTAGLGWLTGVAILRAVRRG
ncbi:hypothetical protein [Rhizohabitans arisaemae]|uniref:hypothetical protein n=1 Tax=Rhizohabitans arisaemae TaxID=2720610 RepID=UPI0024B150CB|nr:hypothetical protein [Rhizohabitans arisaemae]